MEYPIRLGVKLVPYVMVAVRLIFTNCYTRYLNYCTCSDGTDGSYLIVQIQVTCPSQDPTATLSHSYRARLCRLVANPTGYEFNVHTERYRVGHYIGSVEARSPAATAGLRPDDRIIEVDGQNVETDSHDELIEKIARDRGEDQLILLVVDQKADEYFTEHDLELAADHPYVERCGFGDRPISEDNHDPNRGLMSGQSAVCFEANLIKFFTYSTSPAVP